MPLHEPTQNSGPETIDMGDSGSAAAKTLLPVVLACAVRWNVSGGEWEYNYFDTTGWHVFGTDTTFNPPFRVRRVLISDNSNEQRRIVYDLAGNGEQRSITYQVAVNNYFRTNEMHDLHITKLYLDQITADGADHATHIMLFG